MYTTKLRDDEVMKVVICSTWENGFRVGEASIYTSN